MANAKLACTGDIHVPAFHNKKDNNCKHQNLNIEGPLLISKT